MFGHYDDEDPTEGHEGTWWKVALILLAVGILTGSLRCQADVKIQQVPSSAPYSITA